MTFHYREAYPSFSCENMEWQLQQPPGDLLPCMPCAFEHHFGAQFFSFLRSHPDREENFTRAMTDLDCFGEAL